MQRRHFLAAATSAALSVGALEACSEGKKAGGPATIKLLEYQKTRATAAEKLIPKFEKAMKAKGTDVKVELVTDILTDSQFKTKITQELHSGTAPDVIDMGGSYVPGFAGAGYLLELDDYLKDWSGWKDYYPQVKDPAKQSDGHYYAITHEASVQSLFYRKDVLTKLKIDTSQPETWTDLIGRLKAISAKTGKPSIVIPAGTAWGGGTWSEGFLPIVAGTDSVFYNPATGKWSLNSEGLTATFQLYSDLTKDGLMPVQDLLNPNPWEPTKYKAFVKGTLPVSAQGTWGWRYDWGPNGAAPIPHVTDKVATWNYPALLPGTKPYSLGGGGFVYAVHAKCQHPDAAVALAEWLASGEALAEELVAVGAAAPRSGISDIAPYKNNPELLDAEDKLKTSIHSSAGTGDGADRISQAVQDATEKILTGDATGEQAASAFAKNAAELLGNDLVAK